MNEVTRYICKSEREFLALKGNASESVKLTVDFSRPNDLNGWYLFLKENARNVFVKQSIAHLPLIDLVTCDTQYFQFDRNAGLLPNDFHYNYQPLSIEMENHKVEYRRLQDLLESVGEWRAIRSVTTWEFVKK